MLGADLAPVGVKLVGDERGETRHCPLTKFNVFDQHGDQIVSSNLNESVGCIDAVGGFGAEHGFCAGLTPGF